MGNDLFTFDGIDIAVIDRLGRRWVTLPDCAAAIYGITKGGDDSVTPFENAVRAIRRLFEKNQDEFTSNMTALIVMETAGGPQQARIFSPRGCHLMGMFAKTPRAKAWRRFVLDELENGATQPNDLAARRVTIQALNTAHRHLAQMHREGWSKEQIRKTRAELMRPLGVSLDVTALWQGELRLDPR